MAIRNPAGCKSVLYRKDFGHMTGNAPQWYKEHYACVYTYAEREKYKHHNTCFWVYINKKGWPASLSKSARPTLWISNYPYLQYFSISVGWENKTSYWADCFRSLSSALLNTDEHELFTQAAPALLDLAGFCDSACLPAKLISWSILFLCCELLCWDLRCSELFLLDKQEHWNHEVLAGPKLCQLNTCAWQTKQLFDIVVALLLASMQCR